MVADSKYIFHLVNLSTYAKRFVHPRTAWEPSKLLEVEFILGPFIS